MIRALAPALWCLAVLPAAAHPHVFVEARVEVIFDAEGRATALRIGWTYDELFSLTLVEDAGADPDRDGAVSATEYAALKGFDADWSEDFGGDTYALSGDRALALDPVPTDWEDGWTDGRLWSRHTRRLAEPVAIGPDPLVIQIYDPGYYVAYTIAPDVVLTGRTGCKAQVYTPDLDKAQEQLMASLKEYLPGDNLEEVGFPQIGKEFSEEARVTCGG